MSVDIQQQRQLSAEHVQVRIVDSDVHPTPRRGELEPFIPAAFRDLFVKRANGAGGQNYYDAPDYAHAYAMRTDTFPTTATSRARIQP
jgi:uncharacterized protein